MLDVNPAACTNADHNSDRVIILFQKIKTMNSHFMIIHNNKNISIL